ncbi:multidrug effflux MFS transporter [Marinobacter pelagius]|uniref:multidrug effflux MFS transporter n=1 Tax=Marinobacter sp. C7 TaxID=2951363 RepID=UPI001EF15BB2|nr:multidrug effflux MFS transporter [Marinobacter sp. C7]MCG7200248.1 multidrug effflux MFS transporter [Marinobacter sp. C7]
MSQSLRPVSSGVKPVLLVLLGSLTAIAPMSTDMYLPAFPVITHELGLNSGDVELTFSAYFVGMMIGMLFYGPVSDRFGRKPPLIFGVGLYAISALGVASAGTLLEMISWRFLQGLGGCAGAVITIAIVRDRCEPREAARVMSLITLVMGTAPILAPLAGGVVLSLGGWQGIFGVLAGFGLLCLAGIILVLSETSTRRVARLALQPVVSGYWSLMRTPSFMGFVLSQAFTTGAMFAYIVGSPFVLMEIHTVTPEAFGFFFGANAFGLVLASQLNRLLLRRFSPSGILRTALWIPFVGAVFLTINALLGGSTLWLVLPGFFLVVCSVGLVGPNATAMALAEQEARAGLASALHTTTSFGMGMLAGVLISVLHNGTTIPLAGVILVFSLCGLAANRWLVVDSRVLRCSSNLTDSGVMHEERSPTV